MVCVVGRIRDLILQLSKSSIYSTKPNVYEKMDKQQLGYVMARLGSTENRQQFFSTSISRSEEVLPDSPSANAIDDVLQQVKKHLNAINQVVFMM